MSNPGDLDKVGADELDQFIDSAIDELFVPRSAAKAPSASAEEQPEAEAVEETEAVVEKEASDELDIELSWGKSGDSDQDEEVEELELDESLEAEEVDSGSAVETIELEEEEPEQYEEDVDEDAPRSFELKPLYEAMLSLDWEIDNNTIATVEGCLLALRDSQPSNMQIQTVQKLGSITCKYLRASKAYATPLAIKFLREMLKGFDVFLIGQEPGGPSPSGLVNELLKLYEDMKTDANRLRATALSKRDVKTKAEVAVAPPEPAAPATGDTVLGERLQKMWDKLEQIRGRLRGASAQGAPFAEAIDSACSELQENLREVMEASRAETTYPGVNMAETTETLDQLIAAATKLRGQLGG